MSKIELILPNRILADQSITLPDSLRFALSLAADESLAPAKSLDILGAYAQNAQTADLELSERLQWSESRYATTDKIRALGVEFLKRFIRELRDIICSDSEQKTFSKKLGDASPSAIVPGALLELGVDSPIALGIAAAVTYSILKATKGAFCAMTDEEVVEAVENSK